MIASRVLRCFCGCKALTEDTYVSEDEVRTIYRMNSIETLESSLFAKPIFLAYLKKDGTASRVLRCFCGCKALTEDEVRTIYRMNSKETLESSLFAKPIFLAYLKKDGNSGDCDESAIEKFIKIYEICENKLLDEHDVPKMEENGLKYNYEKKLIASIKNGERGAIESCLAEIQEDCCREIESSDEYEGYKRAILDKINNIQK